VIDDSLGRRTIVYAGILGVIGIICGSLGAHGLDTILAKMEYSPELIEKRLAQFDTGVRYHMYHTVALVAISAIPFGSLAIRCWVGRFMIAGIFLFSGSLYALTLTNQTKFGMITPIGGLCWIIAWSGLIGMAYQGKYQHDQDSAQS
jgi:uncharacterized membrane protein YgdD (TMEM256/DUF423 family)